MSPSLKQQVWSSKSAVTGSAAGSGQHAAHPAELNAEFGPY
jgi:hypothetical protein